MKNSIIFSDNVSGIRPAASLLRRYHLRGKIDVILNDDQVIVRPIKPVRKTKEIHIQIPQDTDDEKFLKDEALEDTEFEKF